MIWMNGFVVLSGHMLKTGVLLDRVIRWLASHRSLLQDGKQQQIGHGLPEYRLRSSHIGVWMSALDIIRTRFGGVHDVTWHRANRPANVLSLSCSSLHFSKSGTQSREYLSNQALCGLRAVQKRLWVPAVSGPAITHRPLQMYSATWPSLIDPKPWFTAADHLPCKG